jgi:ribosome-associated protein
MSSRIAVIARESIQVQSRLAIPVEEIGFRYSRSSGPGGQHAQKTETRVEALFDVDASETLSDAQKARLRRRVGAVVRAGLRVERKRRATKPTAAARKRRLEEKKRRGSTKRLRQAPDDD